MCIRDRARSSQHLNDVGATAEGDGSLCGDAVEKEFPTVDWREGDGEIASGTDMINLPPVFTGKGKINGTVSDPDVGERHPIPLGRDAGGQGQTVFRNHGLESGEAFHHRHHHGCLLYTSYILTDRPPGG